MEEELFNQEQEAERDGEPETKPEPEAEREAKPEQEEEHDKEQEAEREDEPEAKLVSKREWPADSEEKPESDKELTGKKAAKELLSLLLYVAVVLALTYLVIHYVGQRTEVSGESMENTLENGDNLIVDKISYRFHDPERFDIIVFPYKHQANTYYIKRIIGLPGETVRIDEDGVIYINGEELVESYGREVISADKLGIAANEIQLGDDEYFVLGDNRNHSSDSRDPSVGLIKGEDIVGRAWLRIYPFDRIGFIKHQ